MCWCHDHFFRLHSVLLVRIFANLMVSLSCPSNVWNSVDFVGYLGEWLSFPYTSWTLSRTLQIYLMSPCHYTKSFLIFITLPIASEGTLKCPGTVLRNVKYSLTVLRNPQSYFQSPRESIGLSHFLYTSCIFFRNCKMSLEGPWKFTGLSRLWGTSFELLRNPERSFMSQWEFEVIFHFLYAS